jgi:hypothetical protein
VSGASFSSRVARAQVAPGPAPAATPPADACAVCCEPCGNCGRCPCRSEDDEECKKRRKPWEKGGFIGGVRASVVDVRGSDSNTTTFGAQFAADGQEFKSADISSLHFITHFGLGGGTGGVEGSLGRFIFVGARANVGENHGPFARLGLGGELLGNRKLYFSRLELPMGEVGWQYLNDRTVLELGARGGAILSGRYNTGDAATRELNASFEWGGYAAAHASFGRLDVSFSRIEARDTTPNTPLHVVRGIGCLHVADSIGICADGAYFSGDVLIGNPGLPSLSRSFDVGLMVGFGTY